MSNTEQQGVRVVRLSDIRARLHLADLEGRIFEAEELAQQLADLEALRDEVTANAWGSTCR